MANTLLTPDVIAKAALATLYENTVMLGLVHRDYDGDFDGKVGDTITIRKPATFVADEFDRGTGIVVQNITETGVPVVLNKIPDVSVEVTDEQMTLDIVDFSEQVLNPAMEAINQYVDNLLIETVLASAATITSVAVTDATHVVDVATALTAAKVPMSQRYAVLGSALAGVLQKEPLFHQADQRGDTEGLREATIGRKFGIDHFVDQNVDDAFSGTTPARYEADGIAFHKTGIAFVSRTLAIPTGGVNAAVANYKGLGVRVIYGYDQSKKQQVLSVDTLCGAKVLDVNRIVTLNESVS